MATIEELAESIIKDAEAKAEEIIKTYNEKAENAIEASETEHKEKLSSLELKKNETEKAILKKFRYDSSVIALNAERTGKLEFFDEILSYVEKALPELPDKVYSELYKRIFLKKLPLSGAEILIGKEDSKRLGKSFFKTLSAGQDITIKESSEPYGFIINTKNYSEKITPKTIVNDKKQEIMQILGKYEASL